MRRQLCCRAAGRGNGLIGPLRYAGPSEGHDKAVKMNEISLAKALVCLLNLVP